MEHDPSNSRLFLGIDGQKAGPFTLAEVQQMLASGKISLDCLAWKKGEPDWVPVHQLLEPPDTAPPLPASSSTVRREQAPPPKQRSEGDTHLTEVVDSLLNAIRGSAQHDPEQLWFRRYMNILTVIGGYSVLAGGIVIFLRNLVVGIKNLTDDSLLTVALGLGALLIAIVLHYVGMRFSRSSRELLWNHRLTLPTMAVPRVLALCNLCFAMGSLIAGLFIALRMEVIQPFLVGLFLGIVSLNLVLILMRPEGTLNVWQDARPMPAGEYGLNLIAYIARQQPALAPINFGIGSLLTVVGLGISSISLTADRLSATEWQYNLFVVYWLGFALVPFLSHLYYLLVMLFVDLISTVFQIERNSRPPTPS